jgi:hypothetical protein
LIATANLQGPGGQDAGPGNLDDPSTIPASVYVVHVDVNATVADNGAITFDPPLTQLNATLDGDVVSITASLPDGKPLPSWLTFNGETGQFAGLLPDYSATASIGHDGGIDGGHSGQPLDPSLSPTVSQPITIEVVARNSNGSLAITDFTIDFSKLKPHGNEKHSWNAQPDDGTVDPFATNRQGRDHVIDLAGLAAPRDVAPLHAMDHVLWHDGSAVGGGHGHHSHDPAPAGRAGLSDQIRSLGWRAATAERTALLASLRQGVAGWR